MVTRRLCFLSLLLSLLTLRVSHAQEQAIEADHLVDSIGINTHLAYTNTNYYQKYAQTIAALQTLGVRHIRDGYYNWPTGAPMYEIHQAVAAAGIHTDYVVYYNPLTTAADLENFKPLVRDLESIEGPNEIDNNGGLNWAVELSSFMPTLQQAGAAMNVPVLGPAFVQPQSFAAIGNISPYITYNNLHVYFGGRNPGSAGWGSTNSQGHTYGSFNWWLDNANIDAPQVPSYITESGYLQTRTSRTPYTIPENVASIYTVQTILEAQLHGIVRSYLYELLDDPSSPNYGIMTRDLAPKPSFTAVSNLTKYLSDPGPAFTPGKLQYTLTGSTANVHHLLMQKRDGSFYLALWISTPVYNPANNDYISVPTQNVTLTLDSAHGVQTFSLIQGNGSISQWNENKPYVFNIGLNPLVSIVKIVPAN